MLRISTEILYIVGYMGWPNSLQPMLRISTEILYYYHSWQGGLRGGGGGDGGGRRRWRNDGGGGDGDAVTAMGTARR